ncbi:MAG: hypothetical protein AAF726_15430 [Planctomycetota bacterium]
MQSRHICRLLLSLAFAAHAPALALPQIIVNGDFESGNTGFGTSYAFIPGTNTSAGQYVVGTNPQSWNGLFSNCPDLTTGSGNMMIVNGSTAGIGDRVWVQTVPVTPDTTYTFTVWATTLFPAAPASLRVVFGTEIQPIPFNLTTTTCLWEKYSVEWYSGSDTSLTISISNVTNAFGGNDFALDEISLEPSIGSTYCSPAVVNSTGRFARCLAGGEAAVLDNELRLNGIDLPANSTGFFLTSQSQGFTAMPGGSEGNLCLGGQIGRYVGPGQVQNSGSAQRVSLDLDLTAMPTPSGLVAAQPGETWNFQLWYRDAIGGVATSNFSDGVSVTFQ